MATIQEHDLSIDDPDFYSRAFTLVSRERKQLFALESDNFKRVCAEEYTELSRRFDITGIQESCAVRSVLRTRRLANLLINDKGELNLTVLPKVIVHLTAHLYSLGPDRQYDAKRQEHLLSVLQSLNESVELQRLIKSVDKPIAHKHADDIIRDTLLLPPNTSITDAHARRAALSAWMCMLRQNVGSCFATAPAIIVQSEQPQQFLKDISAVLGTGRLKRTFGGIEYSVPLSASWGAGDLKKPFYLKTGEAFEETKLWLNPGFLAAFETVGLVDREADQHIKDEKVKEILRVFVEGYEQNHGTVIVTAEEILRRVLLGHLKITEQDLIDYENRPHVMLQSSLLIQTPIGGGKGDLCASFYTLFEQASSAFKSLSDNALLKAWEFTLASFAETKSQFTRWNLYSSLGLGSDEKGGIGACIYELLNQKLEEFKRKIDDFQFEYEQAFTQLKTMESRMRHVSSEREAQFLKMEYQTKRNEFYTLEEMRDDLHSKSQRTANMYQVLIDHYDELFPQYFQEVYDADMHDVHTGPYDDSPAGFRLLFKYGRSNTSQWTPVKNANEFIDALASFFTVTENEISKSKDLEGMDTILSEVITAVVSQVRTKEFLETAFYRMAVAHKTRIIKDPLEHLDEIEKKPWAYTSGGTMSTLVSCYFKLPEKPTEIGRWVENPTELLTFLADTVKQIPPKLTEPYIASPEKSMLIHSPTHAFLFKPGRPVFKDIWTNDSYTYTWVRDHHIIPRQRFIDNIVMDEAMMMYFIEKFAEIIPIEHRHYFKKTFGRLYGTMTPPEFREHVEDEMQRDRGLHAGRRTVLDLDEIDSMLYSMLPLIEKSSLKESLYAIYKALFSDESFIQNLMDTLEHLPQHMGFERFINASQLQSIAKGILCLTLKATSSNIDYHAMISKAAQSLGLAMPPPILFADTNWMKDEFGFVVNPGTGKLDFWRVDLTGAVGAPMSIWRQWLNGSQKEPTWGVYTKPYEYAAQ